jgi:hypothetical protein
MKTKPIMLTIKLPLGLIWRHTYRKLLVAQPRDERELPSAPDLLRLNPISRTLLRCTHRRQLQHRMSSSSNNTEACSPISVRSTSCINIVLRPSALLSLLSI